MSNIQLVNEFKALDKNVSIAQDKMQGTYLDDPNYVGLESNFEDALQVSRVAYNKLSDLGIDPYNY